MQEEVIQELHRQVGDLKEAVERQAEELKGLKIIQQRQRSDVRDVRAEGKTYSSMNADAIEGLQDQMNDRFGGVHDRLDQLTEEVKQTKANTEAILAILRSNVKRAVEDPNTEE